MERMDAGRKEWLNSWQQGRGIRRTHLLQVRLGLGLVSCLSEPHFPHLQNGPIAVSLTGGIEPHRSESPASSRCSVNYLLKDGREEIS